MRFLLHTSSFKQLTALILLSFLSVNTNKAQLLLKDINPGTANAAPNNFIEMDSIIYFEATTTANGQELWRSDGTEAGTMLLKDINPGSGNSTIDQFTIMNGKLYFIASDGGAAFGKEIWVTDGTTAGTTVIDINPGTTSSNPDYLVAMNDVLYFAATRGSDGEELWKSDGTVGGTAMVADINPSAPGSSFPAQITVYNNEIYFRADDGTNGSEIWKSDGTTGGTSIVQNIHPSNGSAPDNFCVSNGLLFFSANNGTDGNELYKTNGTTVDLLEINPSGDGNPTELFDYNNVLYFAGDDNVSGFTKLWTSDGTTTQLHSASINNPGDMFEWDDKLYLRGDGELQIIDGATTEEVDIHPGGGTSDPKGFVLYKNRVLFIADNGNGNEIWISDGTVAGTKKAMDVNNDEVTSSNVSELAVAGNYLFFNADNGTNGSEMNIIGDCDPNRPGTTMEMVKGEGRFYSLFETTDGNGWTHYCDCANNILLSLEKGTTGVEIPMDSVSIDIKTGLFGYADFVFPGCGTGCFIVNEEGSGVFNRKWDVRPTTQPSAEVPVRFYFTNEEYDDVVEAMTFGGITPITAPNEMSFFKVTNESLGQHPDIETVLVGDAKVLIHSTTPSTSNWKYSSFGTDHCSEFKVSSFSGGGGGAGNAGTPLPVELLDFWARPALAKNEINLQWTTASEINNYGFFIERSPNQSDWQIIGFVGGIEEAVFPATYNYVDIHPKAGDNYYRLRQRDFDGKEEFSPVTHVSMDLKIIGNVYPNPVTINNAVMLDVTASSRGNAKVQVFNMNRQAVLQNDYELAKGPQLIPLDLKNIPSGIYIVQVESQGMIMNMKILIQE